MDKPQKHVKSEYDYFECRDYVVAKHGGEMEKHADDFWSNECSLGINNDGHVYIGDDLDDPDCTFTPFIEAMVKEFGNGEFYHVYW